LRQILLLRHAKAERGQPGGRDFDRKLTPRGRDDAEKLGGYLVRHRLIPDLAVISPAARTRETWQCMAAALPTGASHFETRLYDATPEIILEVIQGAPAGAATLLVVGHNPAVHELAAHLVASGDTEARQRLNEDFPTCALAVIKFAVEDWTRVHVSGGRLEHFVVPRWLETATD
jgi:phosphohistidine phosphatase